MLTHLLLARYVLQRLSASSSYFIITCIKWTCAKVHLENKTDTYQGQMVSKVKFIVESYMVFDAVSCLGGYEISVAGR
jgi:hypothetical protein